MPTKIIFCFYEGEPALYLNRLKTYHLLKCDYDEMLELVKNDILSKKFKKRPSILIVYQILASKFNCSEKYLPSFNIKTSLNQNSFETIFINDITAFLDTIYQRGITDKEREAKKAYEEKKRFSALDNTSIKRSIRNNLFAYEKRGRKRY